MRAYPGPTGPKVVPGFGIHPWWSHLHASSAGDTWQQLLEAPSPEQLQAAIDILAQHDPVTNSGAYATNRHHIKSSSSGSRSNGGGGDVAAAGQQQQEQSCLGNGLRVVPLEEWEGRLRQLLADVPTAIVGGASWAHAFFQQQTTLPPAVLSFAGVLQAAASAPTEVPAETVCCFLHSSCCLALPWCSLGAAAPLLSGYTATEIGLDRAATIPGSKAKTSLKHQLELVQRQVGHSCCSCCMTCVA